MSAGPGGARVLVGGGKNPGRRCTGRNVCIHVDIQVERKHAPHCLIPFSSPFFLSLGANAQRPPSLAQCWRSEKLRVSGQGLGPKLKPASPVNEPFGSVNSNQGGGGKQAELDTALLEHALTNGGRQRRQRRRRRWALKADPAALSSEACCEGVSIPMRWGSLIGFAARYAHTRQHPFPLRRASLQKAAFCVSGRDQCQRPSCRRFGLGSPCSRWHFISVFEACRTQDSSWQVLLEREERLKKRGVF